MIKHQKGFILLVVLFFLQLFSFLTLYSLQTASHAIKLSADTIRIRNDYLRANGILQQIESDLLRGTPDCIILPIAPMVLKKQPNQWWQQIACSGNLAKNRYDYLIESLGANACAVIDILSNNQLVTADYYRITLYYQPEVARKTGIYLQSTLVKPYVSSTPCSGISRKVLVGRQMYRQL